MPKEPIVTDNQPDITNLQSDTEETVINDAYIDGLIAGMEERLTQHFQGLVENLKTEMATPKPEIQPEKTPEGSTDPVQLRLKQLEQKLAEYETEKQQTLEQQRKQKYLDALSAELDKHPNLQFRQSVIQQLTGSYEGAKEVNGQFLTKDGKPVAEVVKEWLATDYGKHHLKVDNVPSSGLKPQSEGVLPGASKMTLEEKLSRGL